MKPYQSVFQNGKGFIFMTDLKYGQNFTIFTESKFYRWGEKLTIYTGVSTDLSLPTVPTGEVNKGQLRLKNLVGDIYNTAWLVGGRNWVPIPRLVKMK